MRNDSMHGPRWASVSDHEAVRVAPPRIAVKWDSDGRCRIRDTEKCPSGFVPVKRFK